MSETTAKKKPAKTEVIEVDGGKITFDYDNADDAPVIDPAVQRQLSRSPSKEENIVAAAITLAVVAGVGVLSYFGWKRDVQVQEKRQAEHKAYMEELAEKRKEREEWFATQRREGKVVIETIDGEYMAIPAEAWQNSEIRKKAL